MAPEVSPLEGAPARAIPRVDDAGTLPRVFGRYVLFDRIGKGGMAEIFLARADTALGGSRLCVVKQILPALSHDMQFEKLLIEEAKLAARLTHGNVVQVFDLGREDDRLFIVMEYVE
ncbi:MAG TPA: protein kinase, partial [Polyangiales bacterium]